MYLCVCIVCITLIAVKAMCARPEDIAVEAMCARPEDSFVSASARGTYHFSFMRQLLTLQNEGIEPTAFDLRE